MSGGRDAGGCGLGYQSTPESKEMKNPRARYESLMGVKVIKSQLELLYFLRD